MERFILQESVLSNHFICTDTINGVVVIFEVHKYNETQSFEILEDIEAPDALKLAKIANEMGDWLRSNHYNKLF